MPLDPQVQAILEQLAAMQQQPFHTLAPQQAREVYKNSRNYVGTPEPVASVQDELIPVDNTYIKGRIYTPKGNGPFPILVYFHGGGWVLGDLDTIDAPCRSLTNQSGCIVISVDYRLAPEHKFPVAAEDAYCALTWAVEHAAAFNGDPNKLAVGGDSAGGNLAAAICLMAHQRKGPSIGFQLLIYPVTDLSSFDTHSYHENAEGYFLTRDAMIWFKDQYLAAEDDVKNPYASPYLAEDLSGLPAGLVITAEYDPLRDEGEAYAKRLQAAGVPVHHTQYEGMIHGFFSMATMLTQGKAAIAEAGGRLKSFFS
jgi:acetyl esterase